MILLTPSNKKILIKNLYYKEKFSMKDISNYLGVSLDSVVYFFRKNRMKRRTQKEAQYIKFQKKETSFTKQKLNTSRKKELAIIGAMLYWGEGYKGNEKKPANNVDFANSDYKMVLLFLKFLREVYILDEKKFRVYLYCYSNQNIKKIINFWSKITKIPKNQFTKPYIRKDFNSNRNVMINGLIHIRYYDKKLLQEIKNMIDSYVFKYASVV